MLDYTPKPGDKLLCIGDTDGTKLVKGQAYKVYHYYPNLVGYACVQTRVGVVMYRPSRFIKYLPRVYRRPTCSK